MLINVSDPILQTTIFSVLFWAAVLLTTRKDPNSHELLKSHTNELKGIATLMVIFGHTGYYLSSDTRFLFPYSILAGVGVNLFLFLSGFGLTTSALKSKLAPLEFYKKRFLNIYLPMWIVISILFLLDLLLLNKTYLLHEIIKNYLGYFPVADIYTSLNSPLWYFSFIVFYYLIFPLVFSKKWPVLSIATLLLLSWVVVTSKLPVNIDVQKLYKLHVFAFPLGMLFAVFMAKKPTVEFIKGLIPAVRLALILFFAYVFAYTAINSGVGKSIRMEQTYSLITMGALIFVVLLKRFQSQLLILIGIYSYEIYLIQWPLMYRYDFLYKILPASVATFIYLLLFIASGYLLKTLSNLILIQIHKINQRGS